MNTLLPDGAKLTGVIPESVDETVKRSLPDPAIMGPPLLWLVSQDADGVTGLRVDAAVWASLREAGHDEADTDLACGEALQRIRPAASPPRPHGGCRVFRERGGSPPRRRSRRVPAAP